MAKTIIRTPISLTDPAYFCNKSWTLSYHVNAKAWISFHSYIPNFYIAENNFFYSGKNGCCDDIDFLVGVLNNNVSCDLLGTAIVIDTTKFCDLSGSATIIYASTTTTTTTTILQCLFDGFAVENNDLTTTTSTSTTTSTTTTAIPIIRDFVLFYDYIVNSIPIGFLDSHDHAEKAVCYATGYCPPVGYQGSGGEVYQAVQINVGYTVYQGGFPLFIDGFYVYENLYVWYIVHIVGGIIISKDSYICTACPDSTTTTTTTIYPSCTLQFTLVDSTTTTTTTTGIVNNVETVFIYIPNI